MDIEFSKTASGDLTCKTNGLLLHSAYRPVTEAERFVASQNISFTPSFILITEPALSYTAAFFRRTFPDSRLICIRYTDSFSEYNSLFDHVFSSDDKNLSESLFNYMGEEGISSCFFTSWNPSEKAFPIQSEYSWNEIKKAVLKSQKIISTRSYFSKRWLKNSLKIALHADHFCSLQKSDKSIILCASGKSLESSIPFIKKYCSYFTVFCVSSALSVLLHNNIIPDLCITTDGGFWAKKHLTQLLKNPSLPVAIGAEGMIQSECLEKNPVVILDYKDGISSALLSETGLPSYFSLRNGTVSGTAAFLALNCTAKNVYFCGLDLSGNKGFSHTQPNENELIDCQKDFRLKPKETRIIPSTFTSESLNIYRDWFSNTDFNSRLFRLSNNYKFENKLESVKDVDWEYFESNETNCSNKQKTKIVTEMNFNKHNITEKIIRFINNTENRIFLNEIFIADRLKLERCNSEDEKKLLTEEINEKINSFRQELIALTGKKNAL